MLLILAIGNTSRDLQLEDGKGIRSHVHEYTYLGVRITKDGNHEPEINDRINRGRVAITKLNRILWDRDVTPKTKSHIYHAIVKKHNYICSRNMVFKSKNGRKAKLRRNGLLATLSSNFQEGQN
jgi:hypothetical protein